MTTPDTLNITLGTDVILNVTLEHEGEVLVPELIEDLAVNLISGLGRRTALEASLGPDYIVVNLPWVEGRLPGCYSLELKGSINGLAWSSVGKSLIRYTSSTVAGSSTVVVSGDTYDVTMEAGYYYTDSPIASVTASIDNGVGTPSVQATYVRKVLDLDFHNLKGNGITEITTDSQEGDEAVNTVTIKTNANSEGVTLEVRNGSRGNGIASNSEVLSPDDGGVNTHTFVDTDGGEHVFHTKNGRKGDKGDQGDSAIFTGEGVPWSGLKNTIGQSTTEPMTQKAITNELTIEGDVINLSNYTEVLCWISSNTNLWAVAQTSGNIKCVFIPVTPGNVYKITANSGDEGFTQYAFLTTNSHTTGETPDFAGEATAATIVNAGRSIIDIAPSDAAYLYVLTRLTGYNQHAPQELRKMKTVKQHLANLLVDNIGYDNGLSISQKGFTEEIVFSGEIIDLSKYTRVGCWINGSGVWAVPANAGYINCIFIPVSAGDTFKITAADNYFSYHAFLSTNSHVTGETPDFAEDGVTTASYVSAGTSKFIVAPSGAKYIYVLTKLNNLTGYTPSELRSVKTTKKVISDIQEQINVHEIQQTGEDIYGYVAATGGGISVKTSNYHTMLLKKFVIDDPEKIYYADIRMPAYSGNVGSRFGGVSYFDENDNFICSQYVTKFGTSAEKYTKARLTIPKETAYLYVMGTDSQAEENTHIPRLYCEDASTNKAKKDIATESLQEVLSYTFVGAGDTGVQMSSSNRFNVKPNTLYLVKASYDSWTVPDETANNTAWGVFQEGNGADDQRVIPQSSWNNQTELWFFGNKSATKAYILIRAAVGEVIKMTVYEVVTTKDFGENTKFFGNPTPNIINYRTSIIRGTILSNEVTSSSALADTERESAWAVVFPSSYKPTGKPTQLIAMLHGAGAYVTPSIMGYTGTWVDWRNAYLNAGFAVMDINGWGISSGSDKYSRHWGCPLAIETIDKAFEELQNNYNIADKLLIHGYSMGGSAAWAYAFTYPSKVKAIALFAPGLSSWIIGGGASTNSFAGIAESWQYESSQAAADDDFSRIVGYDPIYRCIRLHNGITYGVITPFENIVGENILQYGDEESDYILIGQSIPCPVRIWHGTSDATVPVILSKIVTDAYRRGGQNVTLRLCQDATHDLSGTASYLFGESIDFFKRYGG